MCIAKYLKNKIMMFSRLYELMENFLKRKVVSVVFERKVLVKNRDMQVRHLSIYGSNRRV